MKMNPNLKRVLLVGALLAFLAISYMLLMLIAVSGFELDLDFTLEGQILRRLGIDEPRTPSLQTPMMLMLLGVFLSIGTLIIRQFIEEHRRERDMLTPQWIDRSRTMQVILGSVAAILLALIGVCLSIEQGSSFLPYALSAVLVLRLMAYGVQVALRKK